MTTYARMQQANLRAKLHTPSRYVLCGIMHRKKFLKEINSIRKNNQAHFNTCMTTTATTRAKEKRRTLQRTADFFLE
jgi:hypothetical protein